MNDFSALFSQLFSSYWWVIPLFAIAALFKQLNNSCLAPTSVIHPSVPTSSYVGQTH